MNHPTTAGIRQLREQAGLAPASLARRLNLSLQDYLAIEAGQQPISRRTWCQMQSLRYEFKSLFGERSRTAAKAHMAFGHCPAGLESGEWRF